MNKVVTFVVFALLILLLVLIFTSSSSNSVNSEDTNLTSGITEVPGSDIVLNNFVTCLESKDVSFYGAWWCPHCENQKAAFGTAQKRLNDFVYKECSNPDRSLTEICETENIESFPTWKIRNAGVSLTCPGSLSLAALSIQSGCSIDNLTLESVLQDYAERTGSDIGTPEKYAEFIEVAVEDLTLERVVNEQELSRCIVE